MSDWQPGDLALCVRRGDIQCPHKPLLTHGGSLVEGWTVATVVSAGVSHSRCGCTALHFDNGRSGVAQRFRKIRPHTPDAEDAETIRLLNGKPVPVEA